MAACGRVASGRLRSLGEQAFIPEFPRRSGEFSAIDTEGTEAQLGCNADRLPGHGVNEAPPRRHHDPFRGHAFV